MDRLKFTQKIYKKRGQKITRAQGLVEFAIILPVVLVTLFVLVELARVLHAWLAVENGARAGVRYAVTAEYSPDRCPPGGCVTDSDKQAARIASIHDAAWAGSSSIVRVGFGDATPDEKSYFNVIVCDPEELILPGSTFGTHQCVHGENPGQPGDQVTIVVEFNHPLLTPILSSVWPELRLTATREAKVETYRVVAPGGTIPPFISPTPKATNTLVPPTKEVVLCEDWNSWHGTAGWDEDTYFGGYVIEKHGYLDGTPLVNDILLKKVTIWQDIGGHPYFEVEKVLVGPSNNPQTFNIGQYPGANGRLDWTVNVHLPIQSYTGDYRTILLEAYFDGVISSVPDSYYEIEGEFYFPEYDKTCYMDISAEYNQPVQPTKTIGPSPTEDDEPPVEPTETEPPTPTEGPYEPPPDV